MAERIKDLKIRIKMKAIWIIDDGYVLPAYLSICSFIRGSSIPVVLVFCGDNGYEEARKLFVELSPRITVERFALEEKYESETKNKIVTNRLARMHYAAQSKDQVILLLDADMLFTIESDLLLKTIEDQIIKDGSQIFGVLDSQVAYRDFLYFNTKKDDGQNIVVPHLEQQNIYTEVFGSNWWHLLKGPSINNGLVAFYNCDKVIETWKSYYLKGLTYNKVNADDDQLPLAAAIHKTNQSVICLPDKFNSKGQVSGDFIVYHGLSSIWKMQVYAASMGQQGVSDYADLVKEILDTCPRKLMDRFIQELGMPKPYVFRQFEEKFAFQHLYEDIVFGLSAGRIVEIGMRQGKSTCFMSELIAYSKKPIEFFAIPSDKSPLANLDRLNETLDQFKLTNRVQIVDASPYDLNQRFNDEEIDFAFINLGNDYNALLKLLSFWYPKVKPGGILAGYDYTSQIGLTFGNSCATYDFCEQNNLSFRISFNIFIIEKPNVNEGKLVNGYLSNQLLAIENRNP